MVVKLHPHQIKAVEEMSNGKVLVGGVGTGKTITSLVYFFTKVMGGVVGDWDSLKHPMDLYVFTTARKRDELDWQDEAMKLGISTHEDSGVPGVKLTVESYNNIEKFKDVSDAFIILDEQRMVGSGAWTKAFIKMAKKNKWIMLSATPGDKWEDYIPLFVANGFYKNRTEFKRQHCVYSYFGQYPKLERYLEVGKLIRLRNHILVEMPYERHTTRHMHTVKVDYDKDQFERVLKKRWHVYEERPLKDVSELFSVMRKVVNSDTSRLRVLQDLIEKHPKLIVFYNFDYELEILRSLVSEPMSVEQKSRKTSESESNKLSNMEELTWNPKNSQKEPNLSSNPLEDGRCEATSQSPKKTSSTPTQTQSTSSGKPWDTKSTTEQTHTENSTRHNKDSTHSGSSSTSDILESGTKKCSRTQCKDSAESTTLCMLRTSLETCRSSMSSSNDEKNESDQSSDTKSMGDCGSPKTSLSSDSEIEQIQRPADTASCEISQHPYGNVSVADYESVETTVESEDESTPISQNTTLGRTFQVAEWNGHKHEKVPTTDSWVYLVQYVAGSEAWNCVETNAVVFYSLTYSYKNFEQAQGRIDRLDTPYSNLHYYVLMSDSVIDKAVAKSLRNKQDFNQREYLSKGL